MKSQLEMKKFERFLNIMHYFMWRHEVASQATTQKIVNIVLYNIFRHIWSKEHMDRHLNNLKNQEKEINHFYNDRKSGYNMGWANHFFGYFSCAYVSIVVFPVLGYMLKVQIEYASSWIMVLAVSLIFLMYIPIYKAVFSKDKYLKYYKYFERQSPKWHKKWRKIAIAYYTGAILASIIGIALCFLIALS